MRACECDRCGGQEDHTRECVSVLGVGAGGPYTRVCECARCGGRRTIHASV